LSSISNNLIINQNLAYCYLEHNPFICPIPNWATTQCYATCS